MIIKEDDNKDVLMIEANLKNWNSKGTCAWCGYSFSWLSCLQTRVGNANEAFRNLEIFTEAFFLRNWFHVNGDQTKKNYFSFHYQPFTLEGNFLASKAVHKMLPQSWSSTPGKLNTGIIRIFPTKPEKWQMPPSKI